MQRETRNENQAYEVREALDDAAGMVVRGEVCLHVALLLEGLVETISFVFVSRKPGRLEALGGEQGREGMRGMAAAHDAHVEVLEHARHGEDKKRKEGE